MNLESPLLADLVLPGTKGVVLELVLEPGPAWTDWSFVAYPTRGFHVAERLEPGKAFRFSGKYATRLYAVKAGEEAPAELDEAWRANHPSCDPPVQQVADVSTWD
ncbi:MAG: hypothetical protein HZA53_16030, partial [Planctomycetes bacterium]|nr:hypothetical protein [Planctomycetota bacterium]